MNALWTPSLARVDAAAITQFRLAVQEHTGLTLPDSQALHRWTVENPAEFWEFYAQYAGIKFYTPPTTIMSDAPMPLTKWFEGATLNYAEALLYPKDLPGESCPAIIGLDETGRETHLSYAGLRLEVARCREALLKLGVVKGDRIAAMVANVPEAVILFLGCASIGAVYSSCSPDFGYEAALARFGQIQPKLLFASDCYVYNGKRFDVVPTVERLSGAIEGLRATFLISYGEPIQHSSYRNFHDLLGKEEPKPAFDPLPFDHPLYILYSSGTTGLPKAMIHRAGGALLSHHKEQRLHGDIHPRDVVFYFTTCGWMMWNWLVSALAQGAAIMLYDGSPSHPSLEETWRLAEQHGVTFFGTSARFIHSCKAEELQPKEFVTLEKLRTVASTGSPLSPAGFAWVYEAVKEDVHLASISGGTDIVSCFILGDPTKPVYEGQIQGAGLGVDLVALNEAGEPVVGEPGELVCRQPLPSMPLAFVNDPDSTRYYDAYFSVYPGLWRHGDLIEVTPEGGIIVYGRSDATLNPGGVRIGTAEIYRPLENIPEVIEALAVGKREAEDEVIWLFLVLQEGVALDEALEKRIRTEIRTKASPRHLPKRIFRVSQLPRTRSGKATEIAVSKLVNGQSVPNREVMANPEALDEISSVIAR